ncbi:DoxX family protein [Nocardia harenae]|uniref:DoxX family protein n=1 Tax=Nocardia harenae TaxID=358707 RepID=UPI0008333DA7|nr:DoxX family protein [Nocardia harenae]
MKANVLTESSPTLSDTGKLVLRLGIAAVFLVHGLDDLRTGLATIAEMQGEAGIPLNEVSGRFVPIWLAFGSLLFIAGALTRVVAAGYVFIMGGAWIFVHASNGFYVENGGYEFVLILAAASVAVLLLGPGRFSVDHVIVQRLDRSSQAGIPVGQRSGV